MDTDFNPGNCQSLKTYLSPRGWEPFQKWAPSQSWFPPKEYTSLSYRSNSGTSNFPQRLNASFHMKNTS